MVVATGTSSRHVTSIADSLLSDLRDEGVKGLEPEGKETGEWVLVDLIDIIVHVFQPEIREKYEIEEMWQFPGEKKAKKEKPVEEKEKKPRKSAAKKAPAKKPAGRKAAPKKTGATKAPAKKRVVKKAAK
jgi:hypothetical protein